MKKGLLTLLLLSTLVITSCNNQGNDSSLTPSSEEEPSSEISEISTTSEEEKPTTYNILSKEEYYSKTLGGLLGQFAGFLSGYEFAKDGPDPYIGLPSEWFDFINGPYAGNFTHFPVSNPNRYDRLKYITDKGVNVVFSDDDYHIDIFNQLIMENFGFSAEDIKNAWKYHKVHDWGGGYDASRIFNTKDYVSPFVGTLEAGNIRSWCTEAYIENETIGMDAAGMINTANLLGEQYASVTGYFEPVMWAKLYATMYSNAYLYNDINVILEKSRPVVPEGSWPDRIIDGAIEAYRLYPNDYVSAAKYLYERFFRMTKGMDNIQVNPGVNGAFTIYSALYGQGDYLKAALASSMMGFDGDCTAATVCGLYGIMNGFKETNPEYQKINELLYQNGQGLYYNDTVSGFDPYIGANYPEYQLITDIVDMYQRNFEKVLVANGGSIEGNNYKIPDQDLTVGKSLLFDNYDLEAEELAGFSGNENTYLSVFEDGDNEYSHSGYRAMRVGYEENREGRVEAFHTFSNLTKDKYYRLSTFVRSDANYFTLYAKDNNAIVEEFTFTNKESVKNATLLFKATSSKMDIGVAFEGTSDSDFLVLDDFMLEEINNKSIGYLIKNQLPKKYLSSLSFRTSAAPLNKEMILRVKYRCLSDFEVSVQRNKVTAFNVPFYACSKDNNSGFNIVEIPYTFKANNETVTLSFLGNSIYIQNIELVEQNTYLFR